ncbi:MAG: LPS-assembly protein LptD [Endozoicomonadaceae bacterium]|nr:LPS-assembly protein LptD [Endozoicomonadaceae bacterium]
MANTLFTLNNKLSLIIIGLLASQSIPSLYAFQLDDLSATQRSACTESCAPPKTATSGNMVVAAATLEPADITPPASIMQTMDWVSLTELPLTRQSDRNLQRCQGTYLEPERPGMNYVGDPADAPILLAADVGTYSEESFSTLKGTVVINQGYRQIESDAVRLNRNENIFNAEGHVVIREPNLLMTAKEATVNLNSGKAEVIDAQYVFHPKGIHGKASKIVRQESGVIHMDDATYTTCQSEDYAWKLKGKAVDLNLLTGVGTAKDVTIRVQDFPVFYTPYIQFPIDDRRHTGFLFPSLSFGDKKIGSNYSQPWYWNIAPNYDAIITPRYMSKRGLMLENSFRYLTEESKGEWGGAFLSTDPHKEENRNYDENRWLIKWRHDQQLSTQWDYRIDFTNVSDKDFFNDFGAGLWKQNSQTPLKQQITSSLYGRADLAHQWRFTANFTKLKNMSVSSSDPYNQEPQMILQGNWDMGAGFQFQYLADYTEFDRDKDWNYLRKEKNTAFDKRYDIERAIYGEGTGINEAIGQRLYLQSSVKYRFDRPYGFFEPNAGFYRAGYDLYRLDLQEIRHQMKDPSLSKSDIDRPSTTAPFYALDSGLFFERNAAFGDLTFTQTLEPRAKYLYVPYRSQQQLNPSFDTDSMSFNYDSLWRNSRFSGYDRIGDTNQLALGVVSRFIEENGDERFLLGIGQIVYFKQRKVFLDPTLEIKENPDYNQSEAHGRLIEANKASTSPLATHLTWNIRQDLSLRQDWTFNTNHGHIDEYTLGIHYLPEANHAINFRYSYRDRVDRTVKNDTGNTVWIHPGTGAVVPPNTPGATFKTANGNLEETDISFLIPLTIHWSTVGRWTYDITNTRSMERAFGVEHHNCCYRVQVLYRHWIDSSEDIDTASTRHGIFVQFILKGMGSLGGSKVRRFLQDIRGYHPEK